MNKPSGKELSSLKRWKGRRRNYLTYAIYVFERGALSDFRVMLCVGSRGSYLLNNYRRCIFVFRIAFQCNSNLD